MHIKIKLKAEWLEWWAHADRGLIQRPHLVPLVGLVSGLEVILLQAGFLDEAARFRTGQDPPRPRCLCRAGLAHSSGTSAPAKQWLFMLIVQHQNLAFQRCLILVLLNLSFVNGNQLANMPFHPVFTFVFNTVILIVLEWVMPSSQNSICSWEGGLGVTALDSSAGTQFFTGVGCSCG